MDNEEKSYSPFLGAKKRFIKQLEAKETHEENENENLR